MSIYFKRDGIFNYSFTINKKLSVMNWKFLQVGSGRQLDTMNLRGQMTGEEGGSRNMSFAAFHKVKCTSTEM
jgi:hypothetical protein